ncbi:hypothetical protein XENORESO_018364, partial [Xenotaenia resolanae]
YIIGKKGETRRRLEFDTKTSISIPKPGIEGQIVITGAQKAAVSSAVTRVEVLVESFRKKQPFTHFLSFPLNDSKVQDGFQTFKDEVDIAEGKPLPLEVTGIEYMNDDPAMVDVLYAKVNVADDCRPDGGVFCLCGADGQGEGQSEAAWHCHEHTVQKGLYRLYWILLIRWEHQLLLTFILAGCNIIRSLQADEEIVERPNPNRSKQ